LSITSITTWGIILIWHQGGVRHSKIHHLSIFGTLTFVSFSQEDREEIAKQKMKAEEEVDIDSLVEGAARHNVRGHRPRTKISLWQIKKLIRIITIQEDSER
jgi:hypothetical protein